MFLIICIVILICICIGSAIAVQIAKDDRWYYLSVAAGSIAFVLIILALYEHFNKAKPEKKDDFSYDIPDYDPFLDFNTVESYVPPKVERPRPETPDYSPTPSPPPSPSPVPDIVTYYPRRHADRFAPGTRRSEIGDSRGTYRSRGSQGSRGSYASRDRSRPDTLGRPWGSKRVESTGSRGSFKDSEGTRYRF